MQKDLLVTKKNRAGFSVVEAVIAASIFALITTSIVSSYFRVSSYIQSAGAEQQAIFLAEEGLEAARNIRDNSFDALTVGGTHGISSGGNVWNFSGSSDAQGMYTRKITITEPSADTKKVSAEITWSYKGENKSLTLQREFTNWRKTKIIAGNFSHWPLDENSGCDAKDAEGDNDGTLKPTCSTDSPTWTTGKKNYALQFDGSNDFVQIPDDDSLDFTTAGTIIAWVNPNAFSNNLGVVHKGEQTNDSDEAYFIDILNSRRVTVGGRTSSGLSSITSTNNNAGKLTAGQWTHLAFTWDATGIKLYFNGVLNNSSTTGVEFVNSSGSLQIGSQYPSGKKYYFNGNIDEVRAYGAALTEQEILDIYNTEN